MVVVVVVVVVLLPRLSYSWVLSEIIEGLLYISGLT